MIEGITAGIANLGTAIPPLFSAIKSFALEAGPAILKFSTVVIGVLANKIPDIDKALRIIRIASDIIETISHIWGVDTQDSSEELGYKAVHAEKRQEDFEDIDDYVDYLNKEIQIDKNIVNDFKPEEKAAYQIIGSAIQCAAIGQNFGMNISPESYVNLGIIADNEKIQSYLGKGEVLCDNIQRLIKLLKSAGIVDMQEVDDFLSDTGEYEERLRSGEALAESLESMDLDEDTITIIQDLSDAVQGN